MLPMVSMECRAAADPELRFSPSGVAVSRIRTVSSSRKRLDDGSWVDDKTCWLDVTCFKQLAENVAESVAKGDLLVVTGKLQTDEWEDRETGQKRSATKMIADSVAVSLAFRTVKHGSSSGASRSSTPDDDDPFATPSGGSDDPPPF
jgi:single-strand DNA-binding protein